MKTKLIILILTLCAMLSLLNATDDLQTTMSKLSGTAGKSYVDPFAQSMMVDFNGGWFHKVPKSKFLGLDLEFGFVGMGTFFNSDQKTFQTDNASFRFTDAQAEELIAGVTYPASAHDQLIDQITGQDFFVNFSGPTIIGKEYDAVTGENSINVNFQGTVIPVSTVGGSQDITIPAKSVPLKIGGILSDLPAMPLAAPQLTLGTIAGTQLSFRYLPEMTTTDQIGNIKYSGFGIQHNPMYWSPIKIPVDVALAFFTQNLKVGEIAEISGSTIGINVAKTFGAKLLSVTPYGGLASESAKVKFHYNYVPEVASGSTAVPVKVAFDIKGENTTRATLGLSFRLAIINLNFDYNLGKYSSGTFGFMFNFSW